jgi:hypothetical protein
MFVGHRNARSTHIEPEHMDSALSASQVLPFIGHVNYRTCRTRRLAEECSSGNSMARVAQPPSAVFVKWNPRSIEAA